jgi:hypothetical protein
MPPVRYELGFYIPEDDILHRHRLETSNRTRLYVAADCASQLCDSVTKVGASFCFAVMKHSAWFSIVLQYS